MQRDRRYGIMSSIRSPLWIVPAVALMAATILKRLSERISGSRKLLLHKV